MICGLLRRARNENYVVINVTCSATSIGNVTLRLSARKEHIHWQEFERRLWVVSRPQRASSAFAERAALEDRSIPEALNLCLLGYDQGVVQLDTQVPDGALNIGVAE